MVPKDQKKHKKYLMVIIPIGYKTKKICFFTAKLQALCVIYIFC
jgi:hypothetical protein